MITNRPFALAVLAASLVGLAACSSDDDDPDDTGTPDPTMQPDGGTDSPTDTGGGTPDTGGTDVPGPDEETPPARTGVDLTDPVPRLALAECGTLPLAETASSTAAAAPAVLTEGELVGGTLERGSAHYWNIELQPGFHHIVVDTRESTGRRINVGLDVADVGAPEGSPGLLIEGNEADFRTRLATFFENPSARTVTLELTPNFLGEDYVLGVFANGRDIPSPRFTDCPEITPLALDTAQVAQFAELGSEADDQAWYRAELPAGGYTVEASATRPDGVESNIIYAVTLFDEFGQAEGAETVVESSGVGTLSNDTGTFTRAEAGPVWLRLDASNDGTDIQITVRGADDS